MKHLKKKDFLAKLLKMKKKDRKKSSEKRIVKPLKKLLKRKKEKESKKKQKTVEVKEVRLSPNIDTNDLNTKINNAKKFISKGNKVKVTLRFRGREMAHVQQSKHILDDFAETLADVAVVEKPAKMEGRAMSMVLAEKR